MACVGIAAVRGFRRHWGSWNASFTDMGGGGMAVFMLLGLFATLTSPWWKCHLMLCTHVSLTCPVVRNFRLVAFTLWKLEDATG